MWGADFQDNDNTKHGEGSAKSSDGDEGGWADFDDGSNATEITTAKEEQKSENSQTANVVS